MKEMAPKSWLDAARRTMSWLSTQLRADGGWTHSDDCGAYFKSIPAFTAHGMLAEAQRCVNYVAKNFLTDDGDIRNSARVKSDDGVYEQHADTYFNYLVALGAWRLGRFDVAFPVVDHIAARHVGATGGFLIQRAGADAVGQQDIFSTGGGTVAMLTAGRLDGALQGGQWLLNLLQRQEGSPTLYYRTDKRGQLIKEYVEDEQKRYLMDPSRPDQMYVLPGTASAVLALLYQATGKEAFLEASKSCLNRWTTEWIFDANIQCCKHGWAAGLLYGITAEEKYRNIVERAAKSLIAMQNDEGYWPFADLSWGFCYSFNAELAYWLAEYTRLVER